MPPTDQNRRRLKRVLPVVLAVTLGWEGPLQSAEPPPVAGEGMGNGFDIAGSAGGHESRIMVLIEQLGAGQFAVREQATEQLLSLGDIGLPVMRKRLSSTRDAEVRQRLERLIGQLEVTSFESRITSFLAGRQDEMTNWPIVAHLFGDSIRTREIYVRLLREYPELVDSLAGTPRELSVAIKSVESRQDEKRIGLEVMPTQIDMLAVLLPATDPAVPIDANYESRLIGLLRMNSSDELIHDRALGDRFKSLVAAWVRRSGTTHRQDVLQMTMQWNMSLGLKLALQTIEVSDDPLMLAHCFQAIAKFGDQSDAQRLSRFIDDHRPILEPLFESDGPAVSVGDAAMAAIAVIHRVSVVRVGFAVPVEHETFGFIFDRVAYPVDAAVGRQATAKEIRSLLARPFKSTQIAG
ncbi:hypothetical protein [Stieleria varia]|uniref:Uncharacterized protein n=1 Tax=Stieleria varia TaxID=2528005 RepID=A0A5C6B6M0_9BACT|nr:hypothetical protein [Stieleria varia]TWU07945.1 hypothetical protein Pla52n_05220 [Stieleria varia]